MKRDMSEYVVGFLKYVVLFVLCGLFYWGYFHLTIQDTIFAEDVSQDAVFHVDLQKNKNYELWVLDLNGPERLEISISNGSYTPYGDTFRLMHPEGDYLPYQPDFTVKENGMYNVSVHPLDPGKVRVAILLRR